MTTMASISLAEVDRHKRRQFTSTLRIDDSVQSQCLPPELWETLWFLTAQKGLLSAALNKLLPLNLTI